MEGEPMKKAITIEIQGHEMEDGRIYLDSPDLKGFHYVLEEGQDISEITDDLMLFVTHYLKAEIRKLIPAETTRDYLRGRIGAAPERTMFPFVAELADNGNNCVPA